MLVTPFEWLAEQVLGTNREIDDIKVEFEIMFPDSADKFYEFVSDLVD